MRTETEAFRDDAFDFLPKIREKNPPPRDTLRVFPVIFYITFREMPGAGEEKQREAKPPGKKAQRAATKKQMRSERASNIALNKFVKGKNDALIAGIVLKENGGGRFMIITEDGNLYKSIGMRRVLGLGKRAIKAETRTTIRPGKAVIVESGRIGAVLTGEDEIEVRGRMKGQIQALTSSKNETTKAAAVAVLEQFKRVRGLEALGIGAAPEGFTYSKSKSRSKSKSHNSGNGDSKNASRWHKATAKATARKATHKAEKVASKAAATRRKETEAAAAAARVNLFAGNNRARAAAERGAEAAFAALPSALPNVTRRRRRQYFGFQNGDRNELPNFFRRAESGAE